MNSCGGWGGGCLLGRVYKKRKKSLEDVKPLVVKSPLKERGCGWHCCICNARIRGGC